MATKLYVANALAASVMKFESNGIYNAFGRNDLGNVLPTVTNVVSNLFCLLIFVTCIRHIHHIKNLLKRVRLYGTF